MCILQSQALQVPKNPAASAPSLVAQIKAETHRLIRKNPDLFLLPTPAAGEHQPLETTWQRFVNQVSNALVCQSADHLMNHLAGLPGETGETYVLKGASFPGPGVYYVVVRTTPTCGTPGTVSSELVVTVGTPVPGGEVQHLAASARGGRHGRGTRTPSRRPGSMYKHVKVPAGGAKITVNKDYSLNVPDNPIIPYIEGDGTGFDITPASEVMAALCPPAAA